MYRGSRANLQGESFFWNFADLTSSPAGIRIDQVRNVAMVASKENRLVGCTSDGFCAFSPIPPRPPPKKEKRKRKIKPRKSQHFTTSATHMHEKAENGIDADDDNDDDDHEDAVDDEKNNVHKDKKPKTRKR